MKSKKIFLVGGIILGMVFVSLALWYAAMFGLGWRYWNMEYIGKYQSFVGSRIENQEDYAVALSAEEQRELFLLPPQYECFGRTLFPDSPVWPYDEYEMESFMQQLANPPIVYDRMAYRQHYQFNNQIVYFYIASDLYHISGNFISYPDAYCYETDEIVFGLWENPRGLFVVDGTYLYYTYGEEHYQIRMFLPDLTGHAGFVNRNVKNFNFARMNLNTFENEKITKEEYEEKYNNIFDLILLQF